MSDERFIQMVKWAQGLTDELYVHFGRTYVEWFEDDSYGDGAFAEWRRNQIAAAMLAMWLGRLKTTSQP